jgi:hypothetical protein
VIKAYFIAPSYDQARFWAREMRLGPRDWAYLRDMRDCEGRFRNNTLPVYRVGSYRTTREMREVLDYLEWVGQEITRWTGDAPDE